MERRFPGGTRLLAGGGAGNSEGGNNLAVGDSGHGVEGEERTISGSTYVPGVTLGAKVTGRGEGGWTP
jgi:hypothetical protein